MTPSSQPKPVCVRKQRGQYEAYIPKQHPNRDVLVDGFYAFSYLIPNNTTLTWDEFGRLVKAHCSHPEARQLARLMGVDT